MAENGNGANENENNNLLGTGGYNENNLGLENDNNAVQAALAAQGKAAAVKSKDNGNGENENENNSLLGTGGNDENNLGLENDFNAVRAALEAQGQAATAPAPAAEEAEPRIGDYVEITYTVGDAEQTVKGTVYTTNNTVFRVLLLGSSTNLHSFELQKDGDDVTFTDTITGFGHKPRTPPVTFVEFLGLAQEKRVQLYKDSKVVTNGNGDPKVFVVTAVNTSGDNDKATLQNVADSSETYELDFSEGGIPIKYDAEFDLLFVLGDRVPEPTQEQLLDAAKEATEGSAPRGLGEDDDVVNLEEFLGFAIESIQEAAREEVVLQVAKGKQITEEEQIESFLRGLLMDLPYEKQKNPVVRKQIETLVQALNLLRKSLVVPNTEGELEPRRLTIERLADALRNKKMPIARPIYKTKRVLVTENTEPTPLNKQHEEQLEVENLQENLEAYTTHMKEENSRQQSLLEEPGQEQLPRFYSFLREQLQSFPLGDLYGRGSTTIQSDTDFFRHPVPSIAKTDLYGLDQLKLINPKTGKEETPSQYDPRDYIDKLTPFSMRRALAKQSDGEVLQTTTTEGYVVFPVEASSQGVVGAKRSGRLVETIKRSQMPKIAIQYALNENFYGPIDTTGRNLSKAVYYDENLDDAKPTNGADLITFDAYLDTILKTVFFEGPADMHPLKMDLGIEDFELTVEQMNFVRQRMNTILDTLSKYIGSLQEKAETELQTPSQPKDNSLFPNQVSRYEELAKVYEPLGKAMAVLAEQNVIYSRIDIAILAYCLRQIPDYFFAVLTQGAGSKEKIEQEQTRLNDNLFKQEIFNIIQQQQYDRDQKIQYGPQRRKCGDTPQESHYFIMDIVRRRGDFKLRMKAMEQAISAFLETKRTNNWYHCIQCKDNLICQHEYLQYLQYKNPQDYASIQKQIILDFAGGSFGANYICRNCGLPIADIGFDIKTELREGTTIDVDMDEKKREEQEKKLLGIFERLEDGRTGDQVYDDLQDATKKLFDRFDIEFSRELFRTKLFPRANFCIQRAMTEKEFLKAKGVKPPEEERPEGEEDAGEEQEKPAAEEGEKPEGEGGEKPAPNGGEYQKGGAKEGKPAVKGKEKGKATGKATGKKTGAKKVAPRKIDPEYQIYKTRTMLCALGAAILVELQTAIPEHRVGDSDGSDVFTGYPLDSREKAPLLGYKTINGASIMLITVLKLPRNEKPWNTLGFKSEQTSEEMFNELKPMMETVLVSLVTQNTTVEADLRLKRKHIAELDLEARQKNERLPPNFLPLLQTLSEAQEQGAKEPTIEVGAKGAIGNTLKAAKWIREANRYAKETGRSILGTKFMEGSCCEIEGSVTNPGKFWTEHPIEPMPSSDPFHFQSPYRRNTMLNVHFESEDLMINEMKPSEDAKFNLFLSVCREGENAGRPHELDYTNVCDWCGLKIDEKFLMPPTDVDKYGKIIPYSPEEIEQIYSNLRTAGITLEERQFEELLEKTNRFSKFDQYEKPTAISPEDGIESLKALDPSPTRLETLFVDSSQVDEANRVGDWSTWVTNYFEFQKREEDKPKYDAIRQLGIMEGAEEADKKLVYVYKKVFERISLESTYVKYQPKESAQTTIEGEGKSIKTTPKAYFVSLLKAEPSEKVFFLRDYCLLPALRLQNAFQSQSLKVVDFYYNLKNPQLVKLLNKILETHSKQYMNLSEETNTVFKISLDRFTNSCKQALDLANTISGFDTRIQNDIWNAILSAVLYDFLYITDGMSNILPQKFITEILSQYGVEKKEFNTEKILLEVDQLKEVEKQWFIKFLDDMTPEQRKIELTKKKLGIGELWSKGGTSLTHKYDPDEWNNLAEAAKSRGTYSDAVNGDIDGALSQMTQEELEARLANDGSNLVVVDEDGDHDGYE